MNPANDLTYLVGEADKSQRTTVLISKPKRKVNLCE